MGLLGSEAIQEVTEIQVALEEENLETIIRFKFSKYAKEHFHHGVSDSFSKDRLSEPILKKEEEVDKLVILILLSK